MKKHLSFVVLGLLSANAAFAVESAVFDQPEGDVRTYHGFSHAAYLSEWGFQVTEDHDGVARRVIISDNGDVWIKNPISWIVKDSWIKGHLEDGIITIQTPINFGADADDTSGEFQLSRLVKGVVTDPETGKETVTWLVDQNKSEIQFEYTADDRIVQVDEGYPVMLGLTSDGSFMCYGDYGIEYTRVSGSVTKFPEDVDSERWTFKCWMKGDYAMQVDVAKKENKFYLKGLWPQFPDATIYGEIKDGKVVFESDQYMGFMEDGTGIDYYIYTVTGHKEPYMLTYQYIADNFDLEFTYDEEANTLTPLFDEDKILMVKKGMTHGAVLDDTYVYYSEISMKKLEKIVGLPDIQIKSAYQYYDTGVGNLSFNLPPYDTEGNALNPENLYYRIWIDDKIHTFDEKDAYYPDQYEGLGEPKQELPYLLYNDYGFDSNGSSIDRTVMLFTTCDQEFGVQSIYYDDLSGETLYSNISYIRMDTYETRVEQWTGEKDSVDTLATDGDVVSVKYYDLAGQQVDASYKGLVIREVVYADGSRKATKHMMR